MANETVGDRIRIRRKELGMNVDTLAEKIGKNRATVYRYEGGDIENVSIVTLQPLADALRTTPAYLMGWDTNPDKPQKDNLSNQDIGTPYNPVIHTIPILGHISAGLPLYAEEHIEGYTYTERNGGAKYFALRVKGDSMSAARINDGDLVIVRCQENVENGEIAVVRVDKDDATVKRFKKEGNIVQLIPQSFNPSHNIQIYDTSETKIDVIGKVVECKVEF